MTAIKQLREWFTGDKRPEASAWITGDTVETRAILELADRLDELEGSTSLSTLIQEDRERRNKERRATTESPPEPFRITKLGKYRMRNGQIASVTWNKSDEVYGVARGPDNRHHGETRYWCHATGLVHPPSITEHDIVAGPLADEPQQEPEMAGVGFTKIEPTGDDVIYGLASWDRHAEHLDKDATYVDWSKVPASAIVKPELKRETRKVWLVFWEDREVRVYDRKPHFQFLVAPTAIVEQEITFTHGQGLEGGQ